LFFWRYNPLWLHFHSPVAGFSLLVFEVSRSRTTTRHSRQDSSGRVINPSQRPLPDNTQHSQQTDIHASGGIRTHNLSRHKSLCYIYIYIYVYIYIYNTDFYVNKLKLVIIRCLEGCSRDTRLLHVRLFL